MSDPADFIREQFVPLFDRGVALLRDDPDKAASLDDITGVSGVTHLVFEGGQTIWLLIDAGAATVLDAPGEWRVRASIALPQQAASRWLSDIVLAEDLTTDRAALVAARSVSAKADAAIGDEPLTFHLLLSDAPELGDVCVRVGLGASQPPVESRFTASVSWPDLHQARVEGRSVQDLFMGGKIRLAGDYSRAMAVALELLQSQ